ncbi:MAG TPA: hypothetical protein DCW74_02580 [Alteromonas australica]|uniref:Uncharacterized protein n=1 Tax=Alteromonas australica TaxID=589873 RepID=A0A350NZY6_9ALTE|nr:hypothetical protein [Alteromonas australica]
MRYEIEYVYRFDSPIGMLRAEYGSERIYKEWNLSLNGARSLAYRMGYKKYGDNLSQCNIWPLDKFPYESL